MLVLLGYVFCITFQIRADCLKFVAGMVRQVGLHVCFLVRALESPESLLFIWRFEQFPLSEESNL